MQTVSSICIVNANQIIPELGGTERVSSILQEQFETLGIRCCSYFIVQVKDFLKDGEYKMLDQQNIDSEVNVTQLCDIIRTNNVQIILCQTFIEKQLHLCQIVRKLLNVKLVYTYHRNPLARIKEYYDFIDKVPYKNVLFFKLKHFYFIIKSLISIYQDIKQYDFSSFDAFVLLATSYEKIFKFIAPFKYRQIFRTILNPINLNNDVEMQKENQILFVGRLTYQKRLDRLIRIWAKIEEKFQDWNVLVIGTGDYYNEYKKLALDLNIKRFKFIGHQQTEQYYKTSKIICMTSSHEGLPMVLIEAQSWGCVPISFSSFSSISEIIDNGYNGFAIKPFNEDMYKKKLEYLMSSPMQLDKMSKAARKTSTKFSAEKISQEWILLFNSILYKK